MRTARLAEVIAADLRQEILTGDLRDGDRLPPLDRLVERFEVSPPSIREALRILETEGLIKVQRGKVGGATVHRPRPESAAYMLGLVLESQRTRANDLTSALLELELACAAACARREDRATTVVPALRIALDQASGDTEEDFGFGLVTFHASIVSECGSETLELVAGALGALWQMQGLDWPHEVFTRKLDATDRAQIVGKYREVLDGIDKGNPVKASACLRAIIEDPDTVRGSRRRNPVVRVMQEWPRPITRADVRRTAG